MKTTVSPKTYLKTSEYTSSQSIKLIALSTNPFSLKFSNLLIAEFFLKVLILLSGRKVNLPAFFFLRISIAFEAILSSSTTI